MAGFYGLERISDSEMELEALFIDVDYIGQGYGRTLIEHAKAIAQKENVRNIIIQGDPNAEKFYLAVGGVKTGCKESASIPGRYLPTFSIPIDQ